MAIDSLQEPSGGNKQLHQREDVLEDRWTCFDTLSLSQDEFITIDALEWPPASLESYILGMGAEARGGWHHRFGADEQPPLQKAIPHDKSTRAITGAIITRPGRTGEVSLHYLSEDKWARPLPANVSFSNLTETNASTLITDHILQSIHRGAQLVAVKKLDRPLEFLGERHVSAVAGAASHPHVVPLLFSYSHLMQDYLVFPWARMNLEEYWESNKIYLMQSRTTMEYPLVLWVAQQCEGLVDALGHVQRGLADFSEDEMELAAAPGAQPPYHVDIKPTNILVFFQPGEEFPVLQLTGFGSTAHPAGAHHAHVPANTSTCSGAWDYIAPEVFCGQQVLETSEVWSLGCVFLDFVEWLMPTASSERVPRRMLTEDDKALEPVVEGREAWRDWRRTRVGDGDGDVAAFYFDACSGELSEWIYTVSMPGILSMGLVPLTSLSLFLFNADTGDSISMMLNTRTLSAPAGPQISCT